MLKKTKLCTSLTLACGGVLLSAGGAAWAQTTPPAAGQTLERVEITGSNIKRVDTETASPVQVITAEQLKKSGYTSVSEVLQNLTANNQGSLSQSFNQAFAAGASGVSLRGLTVGATLVLIDGRRMAYPQSDDGERPFVDISSIPFAAVERIEILKDGASAIYGSDAIAGVVNVILKKSFAGTLINLDYGSTQHGGGGTGKVSIIQGINGDNPDLNAYFAVEYRKQDQIKLQQRSGEYLDMDFRKYGGIDLRPGALNPLVTSPRVATPYFQIPGSSSAVASNFAFYPGCSYAARQADGCTYVLDTAQLQPKTENLNLIGKINTSLGAGWSASLTGSYFNSKSQEIRYPATVPFGSFAGYTVIGPGRVPTIVGAIPGYTVPATYPGNSLGVPANVRAFALGNTPRTDDVESGSTRVVAELNGSALGWDLNGTAGYTKVRTTQSYSGYVDATALYAAINSPTNPFIFGGSTALYPNISPTVQNVTSDELDFVGAHASRELFQLPGGPFGLALGADFRYKKLNSPDPQQSFLSGAYAIGTERVSSAYVELNAPVIKMLELSAAGRFDHYDTYGNSTTPKVGFKFTPLKEVALRGTASRGFRAPSATENGVAGSLFSFNSIRDTQLCPVSNPNGSPNLTSPTNVPAFCNFTPTYLQGTSSTIQPEKSKSYTLGLIFEPIKDLSATVDYYNITVKNQIVPAASQDGFDPLAFAVRSTPQTVVYGDGRTGTSTVGPIQYVSTPYVNGGSTKTSGLEFETRYRFNLAQYGGFTVGAQYTHIISYTQTSNGQTFQLAGTHGPSIIGGDTATPKNRGQLTLGYDYGPFTVTSTTNYISHYSVTDPSVGANNCVDGIGNASAAFANGATPPDRFCSVASFTTTNLSLQYKVTKSLTLRGTVLNLFDREPPVDLATYGGTGRNDSSAGTSAPYNPALHQAGAVGRFFSVGADYQF